METRPGPRQGQDQGQSGLGHGSVGSAKMMELSRASSGVRSQPSQFATADEQRDAGFDWMCINQ